MHFVVLRSIFSLDLVVYFSPSLDAKLNTICVGSDIKKSHN